MVRDTTETGRPAVVILEPNWPAIDFMVAIAHSLEHRVLAHEAHRQFWTAAIIEQVTSTPVAPVFRPRRGSWTQLLPAPKETVLREIAEPSWKRRLPERRVRTRAYHRAMAELKRRHQGEFDRLMAEMYIAAVSEAALLGHVQLLPGPAAADQFVTERVKEDA